MKESENEGYLFRTGTMGSITRVKSKYISR